jgi:hypothetical protein
MLSSIPPGSVLGPLLFVIFINVINGTVAQVEIIKKFTDDTKVDQTMATIEDKDELQATLDTLDTLYGWATTWRKEFNIPKCKIMHIGYNNRSTSSIWQGSTSDDI